MTCDSPFIIEEGQTICDGSCAMTASGHRGANRGAGLQRTTGSFKGMDVFIVLMVTVVVFFAKMI